MKIELKYQEPGTALHEYMYREVFDQSESDEALEAYMAVRNCGYEITAWHLIPDNEEYA